MDSDTDRHAAQARLQRNFEQFNPYAARALEFGEYTDVYASLALAFEVSQLRFQLRKLLAPSTVTA